MGRGCAWPDIELGHLAHAWICTSEDPIPGVNRTAERFRETIFESFKSLTPVKASEKAYGARSACCV